MYRVSLLYVVIPSIADGVGGAYYQPTRLIKYAFDRYLSLIAGQNFPRLGRLIQ